PLRVDAPLLGKLAAAGLDDAIVFIHIIDTNAGIVDQDIEPAEPFFYLAKKGIDAAAVGHIGPDGVAARSTDERGCLLEPRFAAAGNHHLCTLFAELPGDGLADTRSTSAHQSDPIAQLHRRAHSAAATAARGALRKRLSNSCSSDLAAT